MSITADTHRAARCDAVLEALEGRGVDVLLVTSLVNLRYLTGYTGSNGLALIGPDRRLFVTDFRYIEQAAVEVDPSFEQLHTTTSIDLVDAIADQLGSGPVRIGFDDAHVSVAEHARIAARFGDSVSLVATGGLVESLRRSKDAAEIETIARAQAIADAAFEAILSRPLVGRTERDVAIDLELEMRRRGASGPSFEAIIAAGPHGALPHAQPRDVEIQAGQLVVIDWGAIVDGYCSDCTRTVATGEIADRARDAYETVLAAQIAALDGVRLGADCYAVDAIARDALTAAGLGDRFGHGLGHGVGLDIHEAPTLSARIAAGHDALRLNDVVTVEPGVYLPGEFGIRIEDLCVVTEDAPRVLTSIDKALRIVA